MQIGIIGLGRMGANIGRRLMGKGHSVVAYDREPKAIAALSGATGATGLADMVAKLTPPRAVWVMLPAGKITEDTIAELGGLLSAGDTVIDGGNTFYKDDIRRAKTLAAKGITYIDCGTSGGVWGLERGYCMMIGGDKGAVTRLDPIFAALAPGAGTIGKTPGREKADPRVGNGYLHAGPAGAGHFVKMVHNGIEYGLMQAYAEGFDIMRGRVNDGVPEDEKFDLNLADIAEVWRRGSVVSSWLLDLTAIALAKSPDLKEFVGAVADSGEGRWTIDAAIEEAVAAPVITAALFARFRSRVEHSFGEKLLSAMRNEFGGHVEIYPGKALMAQASHKEPPPACAIVIFGANGDLTRRLIVPALYNLARTGLLPPRFALVGVDHNHKTAEELQGALHDFLKESLAKAGETVDEKLWQPIAKAVSFLSGDFEDAATYEKLKAHLAERDKAENLGGNVLFYMAVADRFFGTIAGKLGKAGLVEQKEGSFRRLIVEKPFGHDLESAKALNACLLEYLKEEQIYRIDHFLGKETVQNIMALRFANGLFEPIWNRDRIDHVQITVAESIGVEGRGNFYEKTGALRDMVPNHLFQLVAMTAMEPPVSFDAEDIRAKKAEMFKAVHPLTLGDVVRGQYDAGAGQVAYRAEANVAPDSTVETFVAMRILIDNWRWAGVPFYLRTGKRLNTRSTEIAIRFKRAPYALFRETPVEELDADWLILRVQPDESIRLRFNAKRPGPAMALESVAMDFKYKDWFKQAPAVGYETLIYDCLIGDATLFQRADQVEAAWAVVEPVLKGWENVTPRHFPNYSAGSEGPIAANDLLARDGRSWRAIK